VQLIKNCKFGSGGDITLEQCFVKPTSLFPLQPGETMFQRQKESMERRADTHTMLGHLADMERNRHALRYQNCKNRPPFREIFDSASPFVEGSQFMFSGVKIFVALRGREVVTGERALRL
jgi:hypothetical protein